MIGLGALLLNGRPWSGTAATDHAAFNDGDPLDRLPQRPRGGLRRLSLQALSQISQGRPDFRQRVLHVARQLIVYTHPNMSSVSPRRGRGCGGLLASNGRAASERSRSSGLAHRQRRAA